MAFQQHGIQGAFTKTQIQTIFSGFFCVCRCAGLLVEKAWEFTYVTGAI